MKRLGQKIRNDSPERIIQDNLIRLLRRKGWIVKSTHGTVYSDGLPDLWATHKLYGGRWIEVKLPDMKGSRWTKAQKETFPLWVANGTPIWILTAATEKEYNKLFEKENFSYYWALTHL